MKSAAKPHYLIIPGWMNSGPSHWQTHWEGMLDAVRVSQHDWHSPDKEGWVRALSETIDELEFNGILVAHSLGCHVVAEWALTDRDPSRIKGALLVAPPDLNQIDTPHTIRDFLPMALSPLPFPSTVLASQNDPYATIERTAVFAQNWGSEFIDIGRKGHINAESEIGLWSEGLLFLEDLERKYSSLIADTAWCKRFDLLAFHPPQTY